MNPLIRVAAWVAAVVGVWRVLVLEGLFSWEEVAAQVVLVLVVASVPLVYLWVRLVLGPHGHSTGMFILTKGIRRFVRLVLGVHERCSLTDYDRFWEKMLIVVSYAAVAATEAIAYSFILCVGSYVWILAGIQCMTLVVLGLRRLRNLMRQYLSDSTANKSSLFPVVAHSNPSEVIQ